MKLIDIHTHTNKRQADIEVINLFAHEVDKIDSTEHCSLGFHPWHIPDYDERTMINQVHEHASRKQVLAIGECGLDRTIHTGLETQKHIFIKQTGIGEVKNKPLIIHGVKAYSDLAELRKVVQPGVPWILHGYMGKPETTPQLIKAGFCFSFGAALLHDNSRLHASLKEIPTELLFFETDEDTINIRDLYTFAARIKKHPEDKLIEQVYINFKKIFRYE